MSDTLANTTITITPKAADKVREFIAAEDDGAEVLRIAVQGGGCSGFQYALGFDEAPAEGDAVIEMHGVRIVVDPFSLPYLSGAGIDFVDGLNGTGLQDRESERRRRLRLRLLLPDEGRRGARRRGRRFRRRRLLHLRLALTPRRYGVRV